MAEEIEDLEKQLNQKLLVISMAEDLSITLEENTFPAYVVAGIADWLALWAEAEMTEEMCDDDE